MYLNEVCLNQVEQVEQSTFKLLYCLETCVWLFRVGIVSFFCEMQHSNKEMS